MWRKRKELEMVVSGHRFTASFSDCKFEAYNISKSLSNEFKLGDYSLKQCVMGKKFNRDWGEKQFQILISEYR